MERDAPSNTMRTMQRIAARLEEETNAASKASKKAQRAALRSPLAPGGDTQLQITWPDYYLIVGEKLSSKLRACLAILSASFLPSSMQDALARHLVALGKDSVARDFSRALWEGYNRYLWGSEFGSEFGLNQLDLIRSTPFPSASTYCFDLGNPLYYLPRSTEHAFQTIFPEVNRAPLSASSNILLFARSIGVDGATAHAVAISDEPTIPWNIAVENLATYEEEVRGKRAVFSLERALDGMANGSTNEEHRRGVRLLMKSMQRDHQARVRSGVHGKSVGSGELPMNLSAIFSSGAITDDSMEQFLSLVDEYNPEWAFASMEWKPAEKELRAVSLTQRGLEQSPWSEDSREKDGGTP